MSNKIKKRGIVNFMKANGWKPKDSSGFTLIELMVVISIIALLSSIILVSIGNVKIKAKEAKIKTEIHEIKLALEEYNTEHGGYPNPGINTNGNYLYCIGSTECVLGGTTLVSDQLPTGDLAFIQKNISNLASSFPVFSEVTALNNDNKGYIYISCESNNETCSDDEATILYPKPTTNAYVFMRVGTFSETTCDGNDLCTSDNNTCGNGTEDCASFSNTSGACNYDPNGTGASSGNCICGSSSNTNCSDYCSDSTNNSCNYDINGTGTCNYDCNVISGCMNSDACNYNPSATINNDSCDYSCKCSTDTDACNYQPNGTGLCDYSCHGASCQGTISVSCSSQGETDCNTSPYVFICSWTTGTPEYCSGIITGDCSGLGMSDCEGGSYPGCYSYYDTDTNAYVCSGMYSISCPNDYNGCTNNSLYCTWNAATPGSCNQTVSQCSSLNQSNCGSVPNCNWTTY